jgi:hypothetical protein
MQIAAEEATFRLSACPDIGIFSRTSAIARTSLLIPRASFPKINATGMYSSASKTEVSASADAAAIFIPFARRNGKSSSGPAWTTGILNISK